MGVTTWAMVEWEADDALGAAARVADQDERVEQVLIVTPDKDLGQCVTGRRVVQYDRRKREIIDEHAVREKFGVGPESIPDYLGLVGDTADGFPGLPGWGAKSASRVLARYVHLEEIPPEASLWEVDGLRGAAKLSKTLQENMELALLFRIIATVDVEVPVGAVDDWCWAGPTDGFAAVCDRLGVPGRSRSPTPTALAALTHPVTCVAAAPASAHWPSTVVDRAPCPRRHGTTLAVRGNSWRVDRGRTVRRVPRRHGTTLAVRGNSVAGRPWSYRAPRASASRHDLGRPRELCGGSTVVVPCAACLGVTARPWPSAGTQ